MRPIQYSIVVPVYEHWNLIPALLACMQQQTYRQEQFEVILVDNGSKTFAPPDQLPANMRVLCCLTPGSYAARNHGVRHASGRWLVFTDADCLPKPDWLEKLDEAAVLHGGEATLLAGAVEIISTSSRPGAYEIYDIVKGIPQADYVGRGYAATANLAVPKSVFDRVGGFDGNRFSGGDADFCRRAGTAGVSIAYVPDARVDHPSRATWHEIATKARRIKGGQLRAGSTARRRLWLIATLVSPIRSSLHLLRATRHPFHYRLIAVMVLFRVWLVELRELVRLQAGGHPERS